MNLINIQPQEYPHDDLIILGDRKSFLRLGIALIFAAIFNRSSLIESMNSDGEGFDILATPIDQDTFWQKEAIYTEFGREFPQSLPVDQDSFWQKDDIYTDFGREFPQSLEGMGNEQD